MPKLISVHALLRGARFSICEIAQGDRRPVTRFIEGLEIQEKSKIVSLFRQLAETGIIRNKTKFMHEEDGIYAFKANKARVYCFFDSDKLVLLTNGATKKQRKADPNELARAKRLREAYHELRKGKKK